MALYALEDLDDALAATRAFLWPFDRSRWVRLAVVVFFAGGFGWNANLAQSDVPPGQWPSNGAGLPGAIGPRVWLLAGLVVLAAVLLGLLFLFVGSVMEFVLIEALREEAVTVRASWRRRWRQGLRLFGFRLALGLFVLGSVAVLAGLYLVPVVVETGPATGPTSPAPPVFALLLLLPVLFVLGLLVGLVNGFTTAFVVPIMVLEGGGVLDGWRRLWPTVTAQPWQYLAYALVAFVLGIAGGVLVAFLVGFAAVLLLIPFGVLGLLGYALYVTVPPAGVAALAVVGLLFALSTLAVVAFARVPVVTYLRYYALLVLGDVDEDLDLIPERRASVRAESD